MNEEIIFPHLGITLSHVGRYIQIGNFQIAYYGIIIALSMLAGIWMASWVAKKTKQNPDMYTDFAMILIVTALLGARIYYVAFSWDYYSQHPSEILNFRGGGLAIYGGVIAGVLTAVIYCRVRKLYPLQFLDTMMPGLLLGQVIGRWGNFFNREAFGEYTDSFLAMQLPLNAVNSADVTEKMLSHIITVNGVEYIQVHPTFFYESLWNLCLLLLVLCYLYHANNRQYGDVFLIYLSGYGLGRVWIEGLRTDQLQIGDSGIAVSQMLSLILVIVCGGLLVRRIFGRSKKRSKK